MNGNKICRIGISSSDSHHLFRSNASYAVNNRLLCFVLVGLVLLVQPAFAGSFMDQFIDPEDGKFDTSQWLLEGHGFLPVPIIITEPAVGYGLGAALIFFHDDEDSPENENNNLRAPPSMSGALAAGTENGTWLAGGFHRGVWKQDHMRYLGALLRPSLNMKFYGLGDGSTPEDQGFESNIDGWLLLQELLFRVNDSPWFIAHRYTQVFLDTG